MGWHEFFPREYAKKQMPSFGSMSCIRPLPDREE
jgi:hypothetical protein